MWEEIIGLLKKWAIKATEKLFFLSLFPHTQMRWGLTSNLGPQGSKRISLAPEMQNADSSKGTRGNKQRRLDCHSQSQGCLLPDTYLGMLLAVSDVSFSKTYKIRVLPFDIALAPWPFTRCMDTVLAPLCHLSIRVLNYLDDWLVCAQTENICR